MKLQTGSGHIITIIGSPRINVTPQGVEIRAEHNENKVIMTIPGTPSFSVLPDDNITDLIRLFTEKLRGMRQPNCNEADALRELKRQLTHYDANRGIWKRP